jgi:hypothetical protein
MIIGIVAIAGVSSLGLASAAVTTKMVDEVNSRLPKEMQFEPLGWYLDKTVRLHHEYRRLLPQGGLSTRLWIIVALMFACLLALVWALGFF